MNNGYLACNVSMVWFLILWTLLETQPSASFVHPTSHKDARDSSVSFRSFTPTRSSSETTRIIAPPPPESTELLSLLQQQQMHMIGSSSSSSSSSFHGSSEERIPTLVNALIQKRQPFDPLVSIDGAFFVTCHLIGDTPLWEKMGSGFGFGVPSRARANRNLKGQKYTILPGGKPNQTVVNYAEIWGPAFHLRAVGTFVESNHVRRITKEKEGNRNVSILQTMVAESGVMSSRIGRFLFPMAEPLLPTPFDYDVTISEASIHILGNSFKIPIKGKAINRVLYADKNLRIFVSPQSTTGGREWESAGLIAVQVRSDLIVHNSPL